MGFYTALTLTAAGRTLYTKMVNGLGGSLVGVAIGDGIPSAPVNIDAMTALVNQRYLLAVDSTDPDNVNSVLYIVCHKANSDITAAANPNGVAIKEIGLIAVDPDDGNILYAYTHQSGAGQFDIIPPNSYGAVTWRWRLAMFIENPALVGLPAAADTYMAERVDIDGVNGYTQLRLRQTYTPTGTADTNGLVGDAAWDASYLYIKTAAGWKRAALSTF